MCIVRLPKSSGTGLAHSQTKKQRNLLVSLRVTLLTSSLRTSKVFVKEFSYFLMPCH